ncbi:hypothetical protein F4824DRAFT_455915 [Ustulina deusta]|nr:hypothetical protein F4824DRAFT_455915 [Ustulina deusta]
MSNLEISGEPDADLDTQMRGLDWAILDGVFDIPIATTSKVNIGQIDQSQTHLGILFGDDNSASPHPRSLPRSGWVNPTDVRMSSGSSWDSQGSSPGRLLAQPLTPATGGDRLLGFVPGYSSPAVVGSPRGTSSSAKSTPDPSRSSESNFTSSGAQCTMQCHLRLTNQLAYINDFQAGIDPDLALDVVLNMDDHVRKTRERILRCPVCLARSRCGPTILLATMVLDSLLSMFERGCSALGSSKPVGHAGDLTSVPVTRDSDGSRSSNWFLPHTTRPLVVGETRIDDAIKLTFEKRLLRMYLDRQTGVMAELDRALSGVGGKGDVSCKVTRELFADLTTRLERFSGLITLSDWLNPSNSVCRLLAPPYNL